ncbi:DNA-directed RNA polymerase sigma-70 factor [Ktedonobacter sp. SOSP1-85]|uniref:sigma-70 family RNA polymerase sigma factor n=1 Tax=Ktedonobacter sp. SOSP1-85 TaxID=2778367 RepID=UPI001916C95D|nr:sigma-70 family RNA polymerase sigma factor [Ktedonobacter sp. SOSP1-85]GHO77706.1 DNA-directed RNA polymerase sigma-70 factor [Ktedonobacter sp. SOSP1-85]
MEKHEWLAEAFETERSHLHAVAYRLLGSLSEADDAVQDAWLHLSRSDTSNVKNLGGWLTTVVARISLNMLRSRKLRHEESLEASAFEPGMGESRVIDPEQEALLVDSVGLALLVILETLAPAERLAFVLHDIFAVPFDEIAPIIERSEVATRQLASRARRRIQGEVRGQDENITASREVVNAFLAASRAGNFEALLALLDPDVVYREDWTTEPAGFSREVRGAAFVAKQLLMGHTQAVQPVLVNGTIGVVVAPLGRLLAVATFIIASGKIVQINVVSNPEALHQLHLSVLSDY